MKILYFDCFSGITASKLMGALIDCVGTHDLQKVLESVCTNPATLCEKSAIVGGIPGTIAYIDSGSKIVADEEREGAFRNIQEYDSVIRRAVGISKLVSGITYAQIYMIFSVVYLLSKAEADRVVSSAVFDGIGGADGIHPDKEVLALLEMGNITLSLTDGAYFLSERIGAALIGSISGECASMPEGDIIKIGYGLGEERQGVSDALRLVIINTRDREAADVFEAALEFDACSKQVCSYAQKGKIN